jgi:hypothetical protein
VSASSDDGMDLEPLNEWVVSELTRTQTALRDLIERHENVVNNYARVCQQNDKMRQAGTSLRDLLIEHEVIADSRVDDALQKWNEANL